MRSIIILITITFLLACTACNDDTKRKLIPEIVNCDSATIMYYHTAGNPRFFNMVKVYDKNSLSLISKNVNEKSIVVKDSCTSQGKIYFYGKADEVYVVYFSRLPGCMTVSFIKTGGKYYTRMSKDVKKILDELQKAAKEPVSEN